MQSLTLSDFQNNAALNHRQRQYFIGIIEQNADAVLDTLGANGGFVDDDGEILQGNEAREAVKEIFRDGGLDYYDLSVSNAANQTAINFDTATAPTLCVAPIAIEPFVMYIIT